MDWWMEKEGDVEADAAMDDGVVAGETDGIVDGLTDGLVDPRSCKVPLKRTRGSMWPQRAGLAKL